MVPLLLQSVLKSKPRRVLPKRESDINRYINTVTYRCIRTTMAVPMIKRIITGNGNNGTAAPDKMHPIIPIKRKTDLSVIMTLSRNAGYRINCSPGDID